MNPQDLKKEAETKARLFWNMQNKELIHSARQADIDELLAEYIDRTWNLAMERASEIAREFEEPIYLKHGDDMDKILASRKKHREAIASAINKEKV